MLCRKIKYRDTDGKEVIEEFCFHLSVVEVTQLNFEYPNGLDAYIKRIIAEKNMSELVHVFTDVILRSFGKKSADRKSFVKNEDTTKAFSETEAFSNLFMELAVDSEAAKSFMLAILPKKG